MTRIVKFSECVEYMIKGPFGSDMKKSLYVPKGDNTYKVYIQGNAIQQDETLGDYYVSEEYFHEKLERFEVHPGDYIITCDGTLGKFIKLSDGIERGVISSSLLLLKLKEEIINDKYFELLWEHTMLATLASQARNACLVHLPSAKAIGDLEVELPEMSEQLAIAEKAFSVKRNIAYREKQQELLDELIKARFVEMFGSIEEEKTLGEISEFVTVGIANSATHAYAKSGIPMLRNQNIKENHLDDSDLIYIKPEFAALYESKKLKENDIIAMRTGYPGVACLVPKKYEGCHTFTTLIVRLKPDNNPSYVCGFINSDLGKRFIDSEKVGVAQQNVGAKSLAKMPIKIAPEKLQNEYADFVKQVDKSKVVIQESLNKSQLLFDSLMQVYFGSGERKE